MLHIISADCTWPESPSSWVGFLGCRVLHPPLHTAGSFCWVYHHLFTNHLFAQGATTPRSCLLVFWLGFICRNARFGFAPFRQQEKHPIESPLIKMSPIESPLIKKMRNVAFLQLTKKCAVRETLWAGIRRSISKHLWSNFSSTPSEVVSPSLWITNSQIKGVSDDNTSICL